MTELKPTGPANLSRVKRAPQLPSVNCKHGAPSGRPDWPYTTGNVIDKDHPTAFAVPARCFKLRMIDGGNYDSGGAYWGNGLPVFCATNDVTGVTLPGGHSFQLFVRARDRVAAKKEFLKIAPKIRWK